MKNQTERKERKWLTKKDAMRYISVSQRTIENYISEGYLKAYQLRGKIFLDQFEIDECLSMSRSGSSSSNDKHSS